MGWRFTTPTLNKGVSGKTFFVRIYDRKVDGLVYGYRVPEIGRAMRKPAPDRYWLDTR